MTAIAPAPEAVANAIIVSSNELTVAKSVLFICGKIGVSKVDVNVGYPFGKSYFWAHFKLEKQTR
jgi:hypothetical protein